MRTDQRNMAELVPINYPCRVRRLSVMWDGKNWSVSREEMVPSMTLPAPSRLPNGKLHGFWIEAVGDDGRIFHREVQSHPLLGIELFNEGGTITRHPLPRSAVTIDVLIPAVPEVVELHIVSTFTPGATGGDKSIGPTRTVLKLSSPPREPGRKNSGNAPRT